MFYSQPPDISMLLDGDISQQDIITGIITKEHHFYFTIDAISPYVPCRQPPIKTSVLYHLQGGE